MPKRRNETEEQHAFLGAKKARVDSSSEPTNLKHADYTIGWICALPKEQTAAIAMLDRKHPDLPSSGNDDNVYTFGSIGGHNIVIACLPKGRYGTNSAATIATKMISCFPSIKFGLLVGIGGGIPSKVRLGDVVVSAPIDQYPGVVQWDLGKAEDGGKFRRTGALNSPPTALLQVLSKLESEHEMQESKISSFLDEMRQKWPKLYPKYFWNASLRDPRDKNSEGAANTGTDTAINEPRTRCPDIHHGLIASGNQVIKDATVRDRLDEDLDGNVLCIEMEAAGLMNDFPCVVVRGICDYADSGKNKDWQEYAAAVAAAYAKEILSVLQVCAVEHMDSVKDILSNINAELGSIRTAFSEIVSRQYTQEHQAFLHWLTPVDYTLQQKDYFSKRQPGTGQWLLSSDLYRNWVATSQKTMFCPGIPGAGKTILTSIIVNDLFERFNQDTTVGIAYLYCNFRRHDEQKLHDLLISLLKQLAHGQSCFPENAKTIFDAYNSRTQRPSLNDTKKLLQCIVASYSRVFILIDALDECQGSDGCRANLLTDIFLLRDSSKANIFATSRFIPEIMERFGALKHIEIRASEDDVRRYVHGQLEGGNMEHLPSLIKNKPTLKDEITRGISDAVDGMFLLAKIYLDALVDKVTIADVRDAVALLPQQMAGSGEDQRLEILNQAYESAWERINGQKEGFRNIATRVLAWISCAKRPLSIKELQLALAVKAGTDELDEDAIPQVHDMVSFCAGLVTVEEESNIIRLVHYTTQEFFERKKSEWFPSAEATIAETCIGYLSFTTFGEYCLEHNQQSLRTHEFYKYASYYWGDHARIAGQELDKIVLGFLMSGAKASNACQVMLDHFRWGFLHNMLKDDSDYKLPMSGLHLAVHFALYEAIDSLLKNGCSINGTKGLVRTPLLLAIFNGHIGIAQMLLDNGARVGWVRGLSEIYLHAAMEPKIYNVGFVKRLIARGIADKEDISKYLVPAAQFGHEAIVELLLRIRANVDAAGIDCDTPLCKAAQYGQEAIAKLLLEKGANPSATGWLGDTPLHRAVNYRQETIIKMLLDKGADINAANQSGEIPLHMATGYYQVAKLLLDKGANLSARDMFGETPLHKAVGLHREAMASRLLLDEGADIDAVNNLGYTPLHWAACLGQVAMAKLLLEKGANVGAKDKNGNTPLHFAAADKYRPTDAATIDLLLQNGAKIEALNNKGRTPLLMAVECNFWKTRDGDECDHEAAIDVLLKKGATIEAADNDGHTPLLFAAKGSPKAIIHLLMRRGANINAVTYGGQTLLHLATQNFKRGVIDILFGKDANIEAVDNKGCTPLLYAVQEYERRRVSWGETDFGLNEIQQLLEKGANINPPNYEGRTPLSYELIERWSRSKVLADPEEEAS